MKTATALCVFLLCVCLYANGNEKASVPIFACNLKAISAAERPRYNNLVKRIRAGIVGRTPIANGYAFTLNNKTVTLPEAAEWASMERLCCPFLTIQLTATGNQPQWLITLTGPEGVKPLIEAEFP